ncbi:MAG: carboxypeptidase-like regulatory domain-containing protein, partial [Acidobacteriota bacterium]
MTRRSRTPLRKFALFALLSFWSLPALGQGEKAAITGMVTDNSGAALAETRVVARHLATSLETATIANSAGKYYLLLLPGRYKVTASMAGFASLTVEDVVLTVNQAVTLDLRMELATVEQSITVAGTTPLLEQESAALGAAIQSEKILELPLLGRNPYALVVLAPAVTPKGNAGTGPLINGGRSNANAVLLDGGQVLNATTNDAAYMPPLESVSEFRVQTNSYSAEFGRTSGGVLNAYTKSGGNEFHGSLYEFLRHDRLNANTYTNNLFGLPREGFRRNEFGATLGGPVWLPRIYSGRERTFFFANWEGVRQRTPRSVVATVPTAAERSGDFSGTLLSPGRPILVYDPQTTREDPSRPGAYLRTPFPGNRMPAARLDPVALKVLPYFPAPNVPGDPVTGQRNFLQAGSDSNDTDRLLVRIDQAIGSRQRWLGRWGWEQYVRDSTARVNDAFPRQTSTSLEPITGGAFSLILSDAVTFRPNLLGEFRAGYTRNRRDSLPTSRGFNVGSLGFAPTMAAAVRAPLFPRLTVSDAAPLGPDTTALRLSRQENRQGQGSLTWVRGRHTAKVGGDVEIFRNNTYSPSSPAGSFDFGRAYTQGPDPARASTAAGYGLATFLLGLPTGGALTMDPALATLQVYAAVYFQDAIRLTRSLALEIGLRHEYTTPWKDRFNQLAFFDPAATDPLTREKGLLRFVTGERRGQTDPDRNNFAPRAGVAWKVAPRLVLRAGYGVFYAQGNGGIGAVSNELGSGFQTSTPVFLGPPDPIPFRPPIGAALANPFATGFDIPPSALVGGTISTSFRHYLTPFNHQWTTSLQRQIARDLVVETAYSASRGQRLWQNRARNAAPASQLALGSELLRQATNPYFGKIQTGALSAPTVARRQLLVPFPHYVSISQFRDTVGDSVYHAFTVKVDKRFAQGFALLASYTASKLIDNTGEHFASRTSVTDPNNLRADRSLADYDMPQRLVISHVWELPFGRGRRFLDRGALAQLAGGWQLNGITSFQSGFPIVISTPNVSNLPGLSSRAVRVRSGKLPQGQTPDRWFDTAAFAPAEPFTLGTDSRTQPDLRTPGRRNFDWSVSRNQQLTERVRLQFRVELFNLFNTPELDDPNGGVTSRDFGRIVFVYHAGSPGNAVADP